MILIKSICAGNSKSIARHGRHVTQEIYLDKLSMHSTFHSSLFRVFGFHISSSFRLPLNFQKTFSTVSYSH